MPFCENLINDTWYLNCVILVSSQFVLFKFPIVLARNKRKSSSNQPGGGGHVVSWFPGGTEGGTVVANRV